MDKNFYGEGYVDATNVLLFIILYIKYGLKDASNFMATS